MTAEGHHQQLFRPEQCFVSVTCQSQTWWSFIFHWVADYRDKIWSELQLKVLFLEGEHLMMTNIYLSICETFGSRTPSQVNILFHFFSLSLEGWRHFGLNNKSASPFWLRSWIPFSGKNWCHKFSHVMAIFLQQWKNQWILLLDNAVARKNNVTSRFKYIFPNGIWNT